MAHQFIPNIFYDPHKNPPAPPPTYLMHGPIIKRIHKTLSEISIKTSKFRTSLVKPLKTC